MSDALIHEYSSTEDGALYKSMFLNEAGLAGKLQLGAAGVLRELGLPDSDDGGSIAKRSGHGSGASRQIQPHAAGHVIAPAVPAHDLDETVPLNFMVSPGRFGAPSLIATSRRIASGPAQSVT